MITIPKRGRRLPPPNRLVEIHGLAGAIGEQLGLAWTAEQDVQRFVATRRRRHVEHQRLVQRALAELAAYFVLGASHSLANLNLRLLLLNADATALLSSRYPDAKGFPPGSDSTATWRTFNVGLVRNARAAATLTGNPSIVRAVEALAGLYDSTAFQALDQRRGLDYHRRRPQSVEHVSPREALIERLPGLTRFTMPWAALEEEADADRVHEIVKAALEELRVAMRVHRLAVPKMIRREGITYVFP